MALVDFKYFSPALGMQTALTIILPENTQGIGVGGLQEKSDAPIPALYLLHGTSDDQTIWQRRTSIERYVAEKRLAVVMMTTHLGAYTNQQYGFRYFDSSRRRCRRSARGISTFPASAVENSSQASRWAATAR